jgi:putative hydrolase of HD superfamily
MSRLEEQLRFILEVDKLKTVLRQTEISDSSRRENTAEHSWHAALMALLLAEHANEPVDASRSAKMLLVHDIVEIDAGDTFLYDESGNADKAERERKAAERLFGLLPQEQAAAYRALWEEFESGDTPEARYARAVDRLSPVLLNFESNGSGWVKNGVRFDQAFAKNSMIAEGSQALWEHARTLLDEASSRGYLRPAKTQ